MRTPLVSNVSYLTRENVSFVILPGNRLCGFAQSQQCNAGGHMDNIQCWLEGKYQSMVNQGWKAYCTIDSELSDSVIMLTGAQ